MAEIVEPKVFLIGETSVTENLYDYLEHIGARKFSLDEETSDSEDITEVYSRSCYKSFLPGLNPNVTKVREGNQKHLANVIKVGHGSVLEHASLNFMFCDVSRVFTHELVRHRAGCAISQESLRFVRLENLKVFVPNCIKELGLSGTFIKTMENYELYYKNLLHLLNLDDKRFSEKKVLTSALRRVAPIGLATNIGWTCNFRALRFVLEQRTDPSAEEEIRFVFDKVWTIVSKRYPNLMQGFETEIVDGYVWVKPSNLRKV